MPRTPCSASAASAQRARGLVASLLSLARGDADGAADTLYPVRAVAQRFGGSHAQRDLIDQSLLCAASRGSRLITRAKPCWGELPAEEGHDVQGSPCCGCIADDAEASVGRNY